MNRLLWVCPCMRQDEEDEDEHVHLNKPRDNKLYQQNMKPCCLLVITTQKVVTLFVLTGLILLPIGIALLVQSAKIYEFDVDYTDCYSSDSSGKLCKEQDMMCVCQSIEVVIPETVVGDIKILYGLQNYYQNHRLYRQSQSFEQLMGHPDAECYNDYCDPFAFDEQANKSYYPKGAIANSFFTDDFELRKGSKVKRDDADPIHLSFTDISWKTDREIKFVVPENFKRENYSPPKLWQKWQDTENVVPSSVVNEHFINWMNPAAFPSFTKLYARAEMEPTTYTLHVLYRYSVHKFGGRKFVRLAETFWMGGRSLFLGIAYTIVGIACLAAALFFMIISRNTRTKRAERKKKIDEQLVSNRAHSTV